MQIDTLINVSASECTLDVDSITIRVKKPSGNQVTLTGDDSVVELVGDSRFLNLASLRATGAITFSAAGTAADTVTIGEQVYTLVATPAAANQVDIGANSAGTAANLSAAINAGAGSGTAYGAGTVANSKVVATVAGSVVTLTAINAGVAANAVATTEAGTGASFAAATLTGGEDLPLISLKALVWPKDWHAIT
jgi:hypothetical protein